MHLTDTQIQEYLDGNGLADYSVFAHLSECSECRRCCDEYRELFAALGAAPAPKSSPGLEHAVMHRVTSLPLPTRHVRPAWMPTVAVAAAVSAIAAASLGVVAWMYPDASDRLSSSFSSTLVGSLHSIEAITAGLLARVSLQPETVLISVLALGGLLAVDRLILRVRRSHHRISLMV